MSQFEMPKTERFALSFSRYNRSAALAAQFNEMAGEVEELIGYTSQLEAELSLCSFQHITFVQFIARGQRLLANARRWRQQLKAIQ
jgi:hypothetical protein